MHHSTCHISSLPFGSRLHLRPSYFCLAGWGWFEPSSAWVVQGLQVLEGDQFAEDSRLSLAFANGPVRPILRKSGLEMVGQTRWEAEVHLLTKELDLWTAPASCRLLL